MENSVLFYYAPCAAVIRGASDAGPRKRLRALKNIGYIERCFDIFWIATGASHLAKTGFKKVVTPRT